METSDATVLGPAGLTARQELQQLYVRELRGLFGFLLARCGDRDLAEDLCGETFVAAARLFAAGRGDEVTSTWLLTVARRRLIDHWRQQSSARRRLARLRAERPTDEDLRPDDERVLAALKSLPDRQRAAVAMRYLDECSVGEVADALEVSYRTAESLLARGRRSFRRAFEEYSDE